jgi:hypothetical protein
LRTSDGDAPADPADADMAAMDQPPEDAE